MSTETATETEAKKRTRVVVGGVPEHFNAPWHIGIERGIFADHGVDVEFRTFHGGTGAMTSALRGGEVDVIVALTEGLVADIAKGGSEDYIIAAGYVAVPLRWGVWAAPGGGMATMEALDAAAKVRFGISRFGSGSHLMATIMANERGWSRDKVAFAEPAGSLDGLVASVESDAADVFLWNYSTTAPVAAAAPASLVHVGDLYTPWPCFMIAVSRHLLDHNRPVLDALLAGIKDAARAFVSEGDASVDYVTAAHGLRRDDAAEWFANVAYAEDNIVADDVLSATITALRASNIIDSEPSRADLVADLSRPPRLETDWSFRPAPEDTFAGLICPPVSPSYATSFSWSAHDPTTPSPTGDPGFQAFM